MTMILNPNCSELVLRIKGMSREDALKKLAEVGIFEIALPRSEWDDVDGDPDMKDIMLIADKNNPNIPDWKYYADLTLEPDTRDGPVSKQLVDRIAVEFSMDLSKDDFTGEINPRNGELLEKIIDIDPNADLNRLVTFASHFGITMEQAREHFEYSFKHPDFLFMFGIDPTVKTHYMRVKILKEIAGCMKEGKSRDEIIKFLEENHPEINDDQLYFRAEQEAQSQMFMTMHEIEQVLGGKWIDPECRGVGRAWYYREWIEKGMPAVTDLQTDDGHKKRERYVTPLNPSCSEVVFRLPSKTREEALAELAKIGIFEFSMPSNEYYSGEKDPEKKTSMLGDVDNPNIPDFASHAHVALYPYNGERTGIESAVDVMIKFFSKTWRRNAKLTVDDLDDADADAIATVAAIIRKGAIKKGALTKNDFASIDALLSNRPYYKEYREDVKPSTFLFDRQLFSFSAVDDGLGKKETASFMNDLVAGLRGKSSHDQVIVMLSEKYPRLATRRYYIEGSQDCQHQLYPTMLKIEKHFKGEWHGHDGGGTGKYEDWIEEMKLRTIARDKLSRGTAVDEVLKYLEAEMPYSSKDLVNELNETWTIGDGTMRDHQKDDGKEKREKYFTPATKVRT